MIKITEEQANLIFSEDSEEFEHIEELEWDDDGKYQFGGCVFKKDDKRYMLSVTRSGSYFSDYDFQYDLECQEVEKAKKTVEFWKVVKS